MSKRMTVVFRDEELYTAVKVEAARRHLPVSALVAAAVRDWLERVEDADWVPVVEKARAEWLAKGGRPWEEVEKTLAGAVREREAGASPSVPD